MLVIANVKTSADIEPNSGVEGGVEDEDPEEGAFEGEEVLELKEMGCPALQYILSGHCEQYPVSPHS